MPRLTSEVIQDRLASLPDYWWTVDPGDVNVGLSMWTGPVCFESYHTTPNELVDLLVTEAVRGGLKLVVYEAFNLRAELAMQQTGSELLTPQLIGAIRHICRRAQIETASYRPADHKGIYRNADHKPPNRPHQEWRSYGRGGHAKDSECVGEYHVRRLLMKGKGY